MISKPSWNLFAQIKRIFNCLSSIKIEKASFYAFAHAEKPSYSVVSNELKETTQKLLDAQKRDNALLDEISEKQAELRAITDRIAQIESQKTEEHKHFQSLRDQNIRDTTNRMVYYKLLNKLEYHY